MLLRLGHLNPGVHITNKQFVGGARPAVQQQNPLNVEYIGWLRNVQVTEAILGFDVAAEICLVRSLTNGRPRS